LVALMVTVRGREQELCGGAEDPLAGHFLK
jgi:hypothetical protein